VTFATIMRRNLWRQPRRTFITAISIAVSSFLLTLLLSLIVKVTSIDRGDHSLHLRLITHRASSLTETMPKSYQKNISGIPGVKYSMSLSWFGGRIDQATFFPIFTADPAHFAEIFDEYRISPDQLSEWQKERTGALVGKRLMAERSWQVGDPINLIGTSYPVSPQLVIRGVYEDASHQDEERTVYFHFDYLNELLKGQGRVQNFVIKAGSTHDIPEIAAAIDSMFRNSDAETQTETEEAYELNFLSMLGDFVLLVTAISVVLGFNMLLVTGNALAMSVRERRTEIAVLQALGFQATHILSIVLGETVLLAGAAALAGCLAAKFAVDFIHATYSQGQLYPWIFGVAGGLILGAWAYYALYVKKKEMDMPVPRWFLAPALFAAAGLCIGWFIYTAAGSLLIGNNVLPEFRVTMTSIAIAWIGALLLSALSAAWPALWASTAPVASMLRASD